MTTAKPAPKPKVTPRPNPAVKAAPRLAPTRPAPHPTSRTPAPKPTAQARTTPRPGSSAAPAHPANRAALPRAPRVTTHPASVKAHGVATATATAAAVKKPSGKKWVTLLASVYDSGGGGGSCGDLSDGKFHYAELGVAGDYGHGAARGVGNIAHDLGMPGQLPCGFGGWIRYKGKTTYATKADVGYGNPSLPPNGKTQRRIDLLRNVADYLGFDGVGNVEFLPNAANAPPDVVPTTSTPGLVNPLEHANVRAERIDQGVDYAGTGYLVAIGDGVVTIADTVNTGWPGAFLEYEITQDGPLKGVHFYYAEGVTLDVHAHANVSAGQRLATLIPGWHSGIEVGISAGDGTNRTWSAVHDGPYDEKTSRRAGIVMSNIIATLGGPAGVLQSGTTGAWPPFAPNGEVGTITRVSPAASTPGAAPSGGGVFNLFDSVNWAGDVDNAFGYLSDGADKAKKTSAATRAFVLKHTYVTRAG